MQPFLFGYDFYLLYSAGALLHEGQNPYNIALFQQQLNSLGWPVSEIPKTLPHPVNTLWLYWLYALLPFKASLAVWSVASLGVIVASSILLVGVLNERKKVPVDLVMYIAALFPATLGTIIWGQISAVLLVGVALFAWAWKGGRHFWAGMFLSLVLAKPHLFVPFLVVIFVEELRQRRWRCIGGCGVGLALQIGASCMIAPESLMWYLRSVGVNLDESLQIYGATVTQLLDRSFGWRWARVAVLGLGTLGAWRIVRQRGYSLVTLVGVVLPLSICVAPYAWMHSFVVLLPALICVAGALRPRVPEAVVRYGVLAAAALSVPVILMPETQVVWMLFAWSLFLTAFFVLAPTAPHGRGEEMA